MTSLDEAAAPQPSVASNDSPYIYVVSESIGLCYNQKKDKSKFFSEGFKHLPGHPWGKVNVQCTHGLLLRRSCTDFST